MAEIHTTEESSFRIYRRLFPLFIGIVIGPLNTAGSVNLVPIFSDSFDVSLSAAGLALTFFMLPFVVSQVMSGVVAETLGATRTMVLGLIIFSIASVVVAIAPSYPTFLAARAVQGLGGGFVLPLGMAMAAEQAASHRTATAIGGVQAAFAVGIAIGPGVSGLIAEQFHWRIFFVVVAVGGALAALAVSLAYSGLAREKSGQNPLKPLQQAIAIPGVRIISMVGALVFFANIGVTLFIAVWLQRSGMAGPALAGLILTIPGIVGIVASPLAGMLGDRWGILKAASVGIALVLIARAGIFSAPEILWLYPSLLLLTGTGSALLGTNIGALSVSLWPNLRRAVAGIASGSRFFGFAMAPLLLTPVYEATSIRGVLVVTGVAILIATVLLRRIRPKQ